MDKITPSVCVIGAGLSGLVTTKCMLDAQLKVTCFERDNNIAGRWNPNSKNPIPPSTVTNLPHFLSGFSDFPVPDHFPLYIPASQYFQYFELYAEKFDLREHIHLGCEVVSVVLCSEISHKRDNGEDYDYDYWKVTYKDKLGVEKEEVFDYVVVCSGMYHKEFVPEPTLKALSGFSGEVIHALHYKSWHGYEGKNVLVCGLGNTGGDVAVELSHHAKNVYLSTERGAYVIPRMYKNGSIPIESTLNRLLHYVPSSLKYYGMKSIGNFVYSLNDLRLSPAPHSTSGPAIVNDELCMRVAAGKVQVRAGVAATSERSVTFTDNTKIHNIDAVFLCTGYTTHFPFFDDQTFQPEAHGKKVPLYKGIFSPQLHRRCAFVGMFSVRGSVALTAEMQARYASEVFRGSVILPDIGVMKESILADEKELETQGFKYNVIINPWTYYDDLASHIGCSRPSFPWLFLTDPVLALHLLFKYCPSEYRLVGPNKWEEARNDILRQGERRYAFMEGSRKVK